MKKPKKLEVGDPVLVTGYSHFEKAKVVGIKKGIISLDNGMVIDRNYNNVVQSGMKAEPWDKYKYNVCKAKYLMNQEISAIQRNWTSLNDDDTLSLYNQLKSIVDQNHFNRI